MNRTRALLLLALVILLTGGYGRMVAAAPTPGAQSETGLSSPSEDAALNTALEYVRAHKGEYGLNDRDVAELVMYNQFKSEAGDVTHVYLQQHLDGIGVFNGQVGVHLLPNGKVFYMTSRAVPNLRASVNTSTPTLTAREAVSAAVDALGLTLAEPLNELESIGGRSQEVLLSDGGVSLKSIPVKLVYQPLDNGKVHLAWDLSIDQLDAQHWWSVRVDATTGELLSKIDWVTHDNWNPTSHAGEGAHLSVAPAGELFAAARYAAPMAPDSYRVYPVPVESPNHTTPAPPADGRTTVLNPANALASPFGWHDTNGAAGAESTLTEGNNVEAYTDIDNDNLPDAGSKPNGGPTLDFVFPLDLTQAPSTYRPAAVTNLFYWNNVQHDLNYHYGFDEASANFQVNNYGRGGLGNDSVEAQAQDGGGTNNANFATGPDGTRPRMQMYLWNTTSPQRDGDFDNGIILHEYGHGISNRLTGGGTSGCLGNAEQMGEGWSDWQSLVFTSLATHTATQARGVGTYALGQPTTGNGIRAFPYSTSMVTDPRTYNGTRTAAVPHGVGSIWTAMLWEVYWNLVTQYGYNPNLYTGTGGNNMAILLVNEGMKLQPCGPGFVDGRNAIIAADLAINGGANECLIWQGFAKRGLGFSATQGSANSNSDNTEAFNLPPQCLVPDFRLRTTDTSLNICAPAAATTTVQVQQFVGFNQPVTLSATGTPPGYTVGFNPVTVTPPSTSTLSLTNSGAATAGTYNLLITGTAPTSTHTTTLPINMYTLTPVAATLTSPTNGSVNVPLPSVTFTWQAVAQAAGYDIQVDDDPAFGSPLVNVTGHGTTSYTVSQGFQYGATYYWRVRATNTCGTAPWSTANSFTTVQLPLSCSAGSTTNVVFQTDFEAGASGFTLGAGSIGNTWQLSSARTTSGTQAWFATDPSTLSDQRLVSPPIVVPSGQSPVSLRFNNYQAFEIPNTDGRCWDAGILEVTTNGGTSWTQIMDAALLTDPYDALIWNDQPGNNPLGPVRAWCPNPPPQDWLTSVVDLNAYAGQTIQLRWRLGSDSAAGNEGWYIDDVRVQSCSAPTAVTLADMGSQSSTPVVPVAALALLGLVGAAMLWRHKRA